MELTVKHVPVTSRSLFASLWKRYASGANPKEGATHSAFGEHSKGTGVAPTCIGRKIFTNV